MNVQIVITDECTSLVANDLDFGSHGVLDSVVNAQTTLTFTCTDDADFTIGMDAGGGGGTVTTRTMSNVGDTASVSYALFRDSNRTLNWGTTVATDTLGGTGTGTSQTVDVFGQVPVQTTPAAGTYTDIVSVTLTY